MKKTDKILVAVAAGFLAGLIVYAARRYKERSILNQVANEGYETAHDILFPNKSQMGKKLHYGPVLPE
ncbi:hypothetical protein [Agriterribacter humi]|jgi:hypothetical protein|uniref:hypothetical protein n=1 Tax=Agriterribacter humi TaxID=1104781 RepID=UPI001264084D|nr:hypothetical protein [Agriterribacter humi]